MTRALVVGGGIGGLASALALHHVGIDAVVFEEASEISEVGAGLTLWSNATLALRRLGVEAACLAAGSIIAHSKSVLPNGNVVDELDHGPMEEKVGAATFCIHRATLQQILRDALLSRNPDAIQTGRECSGCTTVGGIATAFFTDGSQENGDLLIGADGIHSAVRRSLFGDEKIRYAGYFAWRGLAEGVSHALQPGESRLVIGRGTQAGLFHCGENRLYWFLTCNGAQGSPRDAVRNRSEIFRIVGSWQEAFLQVTDATEDESILRNDIIDRLPRSVWGRDQTTLLGDAIHATTPNLGQGACQALEDAVILAHSLRTNPVVETALRNYEAQRRDRTKFVIEQSWQIGKVLQLSNPVGTWLRDALTTTHFAKQHTHKLFERLLTVELPELVCDDGAQSPQLHAIG